jgi:phytanoyl-CoA hydroxylase
MHTETAKGVCPALTDTRAFKECFEREGYVVVRAALPPAVCAEAVDGFLKEVHLDTDALFLRDARGRYEPHAYTETGRMRFPMIDLPTISGRRYPQFKAAGLALLTDPVLRQAVESLLGEPARLVHTMYSDGHHAPGMPGDGAAIGAWIAADDSDSRSCEQAAPALRQGDLLLWNALTPRGGLPAAVPAAAQRAFIGHYIGRSHPSPHRGVMMGGMEILLHRGRRSLAGRAANLLKAAYPRLAALLRARRAA